MALTAPTLPITDLAQFTAEVEKLFDNIVESWSQLLFREEDRRPLALAWEELKPSVQTIKDALQSPLDQDIATKLRQAGLSGQQLILKIKGLNDAWQKFKLLGSVRLLKKLLDWINAILGSLADAVPGSEALKELKEAIEKLIHGDPE